MGNTNLHTRLKRLNLSTTLAESHPQCLQLVNRLEKQVTPRSFNDDLEKYAKWDNWRFDIKNRPSKEIAACVKSDTELIEKN